MNEVIGPSVMRRDGLSCPVCGCAQLKSAGGVKHSGRFTIRRRQCRMCGHIVRTREEIFNDNMDQSSAGDRNAE